MSSSTPAKLPIRAESFDCGTPSGDQLLSADHTPLPVFHERAICAWLTAAIAKTAAIAYAGRCFSSRTLHCDEKTKTHDDAARGTMALSSHAVVPLEE
jgi:hypothetical protein